MYKFKCSSVAYRGEGYRGLEPLPLAYDLRNKRVRMHQIVVFSTKNMKNCLLRNTNAKNLPSLSGEGVPSPSGEGVGRGISSPHALPPFGACGTSTPPILKCWVRHWCYQSMKTCNTGVSAVTVSIFVSETITEYVQVIFVTV